MLVSDIQFLRPFFDIRFLPPPFPYSFAKVKKSSFIRESWRFLFSKAAPLVSLFPEQVRTVIGGERHFHASLFRKSSSSRIDRINRVLESFIPLPFT